MSPTQRDSSKNAGVVIFLVATVAFVVYMMHAYPDDHNAVPVNSSAPANQSDLPWVAAAELCDQFATNEVAANNEYKGKTLHIFGNVSRIVDGDPAYIDISMNPPIKSVLIECNFYADDRNSLAKLSVGERVDIIGQCSGDYAGYPVFDECKIISSPNAQ